MAMETGLEVEIHVGPGCHGGIKMTDRDEDRISGCGHNGRCLICPDICTRGTGVLSDIIEGRVP